MTHIILLSSSYIKKSRIAMHYVEGHSKIIDDIQKEISILTRDTEINLPFSTHHIETDSITWESVQEKDVFFKDIIKYDDILDFKKEIEKNLVINGTDVAKYILTKIPCTHLKLQKLVYLCYEEYLRQTSKKLFVDEIYAFKYGPVIESVYERCKGRYATLHYDEKLDDEADIEKPKIELSSKSRIMFTDDGVNKIGIIDSIISKFGSYTANDLVSYTHKEGSAWDLSKKEFYGLISDETILKSFAI